MERKWIEELLSRVDLVALISKYVRLERKGSDYWGCCPFHHEKTPSFKLYQTTNSYHCFGCKESGDAISFLAKMENIERIEAIKILASEVGLPLPAFERKSNQSSQEVLEKKERLYELIKAAARFYYDNLHSKAGECYREYLENRGITKELINKFGIGASLDWKGAIEHLKSLGYSEQEIKDAGIAGVGTDGLYDNFKGRVMFPIIDVMNRVVSFSGRIIENNKDFAKYKNGAQTLVFDKSKTLFSINLLKKKKRNDGKIDYIILVEGHLDAVMMHGAGFDTTVASMGTALTTAHAKQIKNFTDRVYISYDGDAAGSKATLRGLDILDSMGISVRIVVLPDGMDPDDVIKKHGKEYYRKLMDNAQTLTAYKISALSKQFDISDIEERSKFAVSAVRIIKSLDSPIAKEEYLRHISTITGYSLSALKRQADMSEDEQKLPTAVVQKKSDETLDSAAVFVLAYYAIGKAAKYEDGINETLEGIYLDIFHYIKEKGIQTIYSAFDEEQSVLIGEILNYSFDDVDSDDAFIKHLNSLLKQKIIRQKEELSSIYEQNKSIEILKRIQALDKKLKQTGFSRR